MARNDVDIATTAFQMMGLLGAGEEISKNDFDCIKGHIGPSTTPESLMRAISPIYPGTQKQYGDTRCKWIAARTHRQCRLQEGHPGDHDWGQAGEDSNLGVASNQPTLRDQFAMAVLNGMLSQEKSVAYLNEAAKHPDPVNAHIGKICYELADAMLEARKPK